MSEQALGLFSNATGVNSFSRTGELGDSASGQDVLFGDGSLDSLSEIVGKDEPVLLVHGRSFEENGGLERVRKLLGGGNHLFSYSSFSSNPEANELEEGRALARALDPAWIVGIGGGSAMDAAKAIAVLAPSEAKVRDTLVMGLQVPPQRSARLLLIPTLAGSGSEVTRFATIYVEGVKYSLDTPLALADSVIVDPDLSAGVPPQARISGLLDCLAHSVESMWSTKSTDASSLLARTSFELVVDLVATHGHGASSPSSRYCAHRAALTAGLAIDVTRTTAAHAFAYPLTAGFGVPHGVACGLNLTWLLPFNAEVGESDCLHPRGVEHVRRVTADITATIGQSGAQSVRQFVGRALANSGVRNGLAGYGVLETHVDDLVRQGLTSVRTEGNPRRLSAQDAALGLRDLLALDVRP